jgi:hypothetical protein
VGHDAATSLGLDQTLDEAAVIRRPPVAGGNVYPVGGIPGPATSTSNFRSMAAPKEALSRATTMNESAPYDVGAIIFFQIGLNLNYWQPIDGDAGPQRGVTRLCHRAAVIVGAIARDIDDPAHRGVAAVQQQTCAEIDRATYRSPPRLETQRILDSLGERKGRFLVLYYPPRHHLVWRQASVQVT